MRLAHELDKAPGLLLGGRFFSPLNAWIISFNTRGLADIFFSARRKFSDFASITIFSEVSSAALRRQFLSCGLPSRRFFH
ncbi:hypothetical protein [Pseudomonas shirazensis]|uniref:hypothetical protein n=1 Tax=Pseudomonas shirazensis TaxID=2745494 RepID=UPI003D2DC818